MPSKRLPKDTNQSAKYILDASTGEAEKIELLQKNPAAVALGRAGGLESGKSRSKRLSPTKRKGIAKKTAKARWGQQEALAACTMVPYAVPCALLPCLLGRGEVRKMV